MSVQDKIDYLLANYGIDDQRTTAWFAKRGEMLTASEIWKSFGTATASARHELIMSKLAPPKRNDGPGVGALIWGTRFEPIAKEIYCKEEGVRLVDLTCVQHPVHQFLGASPDGLILCDDHRNGRLIELKCPISRVFTEETPVPEEYYHQMQLQMECTGLAECEYLEVKFKIMNYSEWYDSPAKYKSCFAVSSAGEVTYRKLDDPIPVSDWFSTFKDPLDMGIIYWVIDSKRQKLIQKDADWMPMHLPEMKATWDEIVRHRTEGTFPQAKSKALLEL
jgi:putative phage-type endonuclease